jgi:hypothetical protein
MKNILKALTVATLAVFTVANNANAQIAIGSNALNNEVSPTSLSTGKGEESSSASNTISTRAMNDFKKTFEGVTDATWYTTDDKGYIARFNKDQVQTMVAYDHKGRWHHTIRYYGEKQLPRDVRSIVKSSYYDYAILGVTEVFYNDQTIYMVNVQDDTRLKTIAVFNDEMQEIRSLVRG